MPDPRPDRAIPPRRDETAVTDHQLVLRIQARDQAALAALYDRYGGLIYTLALRILCDPGLAEEVMQDSFMRCWDGSADYLPEHWRVAAWLMRVARNRAIDLLRSRQHRARLREREPLPRSGDPGEPGSPDLGDQVLLRQTIIAALESLTSAQRRVIDLAYYDGLTQSEIAQLLGEPLGTIKTRTRSALQLLRTRLQPLLAADEEANGDRDD